MRGDGAVTRRHPHAVSLTIRHAYYGCESGCCGTAIIQLDDEGDELIREFDFSHNYGKALADAEAYAAKFDLPLIEDPEERDLIKRCW